MKRSSCKNETESHCSEAIGKGMQIGTENKKRRGFFTKRLRKWVAPIDTDLDP